MPTLSLTGNSRLTWSLSDSPVIGTVGKSAEIKTSRTVANGTGAGEANVAWVNRVTIASGQVYSLELRNLGDTVFGFAGKITMTTLKELFCVVNTTTANRYVLFGVIGPSDTTAYTARINRGGDYRVADYTDGWPVTQNVNDVIYIANPSAGAVEIDLGVVGVGTFSNT
jgi:hypothetical protein